MADILEVVDVEQLRQEVRDKYREVAEDPDAGYHFHTGRAHARRLGYPGRPLDDLPEEACEAFAGVGNPFFWGPPQPDERVAPSPAPRARRTPASSGPTATRSGPGNRV